MAGGIQGGNRGTSLPSPRSGGGCLQWGVMGCGLLALIVTVIIGISAYRFSKSDSFQKMVSNTQAVQGCTENLPTLRSALTRYTTDHQGKYPANLKTLIPDYLADDSSLTCSQSEKGGTTMPLEYTPPAPDAAPDTPVISFRSLASSFLANQEQIMYARLLKNGHIVTDTVTRMTTPK